MSAIAENTLLHTPAVDVFENQDELLVLVDVPGVSADGINLRLEKNLLEISAKRAAATDGQNHSYERSFLVPNTVDSERITADVKAGVLEIRLPKRAETKPRAIQVKTSN